MLRVRPVKREDHAEVLNLARLAGVGMISLPQDAEVLRIKIDDAVLSFEGKPRKPYEENFLFVMEDLATGKLAGTTGLVTHVGLSRPFYSYKVSTLSQASLSLGVYSQQQVLHMVNDYTGASEVGSLFLHPDYRRDGLGKFLSRSRFLIIAEFPQLFSETVISEIRGVQHADGSAPFYDNLARHFFKMTFKEADYIYATQGGQFIADLMPKYPIYVNLLASEAQETIGKPFATSKPAMQILVHEGFSYQGYIDLFDAGPTVQADRDRIRTVRQSVKLPVGQVVAELGDETYMISNTRLADFSMMQGKLQVEEGKAIITQDVASALGVKQGEMIRYAL